MTIAGFLLLVALLGATALASAAVTLRLGVQQASERLLAIAVLGHLFILVPVYALGALSALTPAGAVLGTFAVNAAALLVVGRGRPIARVLAEIAQALHQLRVDFVRFIGPVPSRAHPAGVVLIGMAGLIAWLTLSCYFAPSFRGYDAPWYHEPITAFAIQERGLHVPALPQRLSYVAGLPRGSELMSAWLVLISGSRALIELPSVAGFAVLWLATYRLARVLGAWKYRAVGWATVVVLTPGLLAYAQSTYVDLHACAMLAAAACFALTRFMPGGALLAIVAAGLAASMKLYALGPGAALAGTALLQVFRAEGMTALRSPAAALVVVGAAGVALATPLRNAVVFGNPLYPISITLPFVGHVLPGPIVTTSRDLEMTPPWQELLQLVFQLPAKYATGFAHYVEIHMPVEAAPAFNYGYAMPVLGFGLAMVAFGQLARNALRTKAHRADRSIRTMVALGRFASAAALLLAVGAFFFLFPVSRLARYLGFVFACAGALAATALVGRQMRRAGDILLVVALVAQVLLVTVQTPSLLHSPAELWQLARMPRSDRELAHKHGAFASPSAARFRDQVLAAGTVVLFGDDVLEPGPLWNSSMTNRVEYLTGDADPTETADRRRATLIACTRGSHRCTALEQQRDAWTPVGELYPAIISGEAVVFQRHKGEAQIAKAKDAAVPGTNAASGLPN